MNNNIEKIEINGHHVWVDKDAEIKEDCYALHLGVLGEREIVMANGECKLDKKIIAASPELHLEGVPYYVEWLGLNELKIKWEHLYINGQLPKKPYPTNFENDLDKFMLGYYTALEKELQKQLITEIMNDDAKDGLYEPQPTWDDVRKAIAMGFDWCHNKQIPQDWMINEFIEQLKQSKQ